MVKLRGVNIWPEALGDIATQVPGTTDDYFVRAYRVGDRDEIEISVVSDRPPPDHERVRDEVADALKDTTGVRIGVELVVPGELDQRTGFGTAAKLVRFADER
jgi:phenylacetate-CoA ligase